MTSFCVSKSYGSPENHLFLHKMAELKLDPCDCGCAVRWYHGDVTGLTNSFVFCGKELSFCLKYCRVDVKLLKRPDPVGHSL